MWCHSYDCCRYSYGGYCHFISHHHCVLEDSKYGVVPMFAVVVAIIIVSVIIVYWG